MLIQPLADVQSKHIPPQHPAWEESNGHETWGSRAGEVEKKFWYRTTQHSKSLFSNNSTKALLENIPTSSSQHLLFPYRHLHSELHTRGARLLFSA